MHPKAELRFGKATLTANSIPADKLPAATSGTPLTAEALITRMEAITDAKERAEFIKKHETELWAAQRSLRKAS